MMDVFSATYATPGWVFILAALAGLGLVAVACVLGRGRRGAGQERNALEERLAGREKSLEALRASEERLKGLYGVAPVGVLRTSADGGTVLMADDSAARIFGYSTAGELREQFSPSDAYLDPPRRQELLEAVRAQGAVEGFEIAVRRADGARRWLSLWLRGSGDGQGLEGAVMDVTDRRRMERELRDGHLFMQAVLGAMADPFFYLDRQGAMLHVNRAMEEFMSLEREELLGKRPVDLAPDEASGPWTRAMEAVLAPDGPALERFETWMRTRGGGRREVVVRLAAVADSAGRRIGLAGTLTDATELLRAQSGLHRAEEAYRAAFDFCPEALFATLPDGRMVRANEAAATLFGYGSARDLLEAVGDVARDLYAHGMKREAVLGRVRAEGVVRGLELDVKRADGSVVRVVADLRGVADADGGLVRIEGLAEEAAVRKLRESTVRGRPSRPEPLGLLPDD